MKLSKLAGASIAVAALAAVLAPTAAFASTTPSTWATKSFKGFGLAPLSVTVSCPASRPMYLDNWDHESTRGNIVVWSGVLVEGNGTKTNPDTVTFTVNNIDPFAWNWGGNLKIECGK